MWDDLLALCLVRDCGRYSPKCSSPDNEPQYLNIYIEKPVGTDIDATDRISSDIEQIVMATMAEERFQEDRRDSLSYMITSLIGQVGNGTSDPAQGPSMGNTPNKARVTLSFVKFQERGELTTTDILNALRDRLAAYPDAEIVVSKTKQARPKGTINIEASGSDYNKVMVYEQMKEYIEENIGGIEELKLDVNKEKPELPVIIDKEKAKMFGLSTAQIGSALRTALLDERFATSWMKMNTPSTFASRRPATTWTHSWTNASPSAIRRTAVSRCPSRRLPPPKTPRRLGHQRKDLTRVITISSNVLDGYNANEVVAAIKVSCPPSKRPRRSSGVLRGSKKNKPKRWPSCPHC